MRLLVVAGLAGFVGFTLVLSELRWFSRRTLSARIAPYTPGGRRAAARSGLLSVESFRDVVAPLSSSFGAGAARLFGVSEELAVRLRRIHSPLDATEFRVRQLGWSLATFGVGGALSAVLSLPVAFTILLTLGLPLLTFLVQEQKVALASERRQRRVLLELPVIAEQLGMLLSAGYSLGSALQRLAHRGHGAISEDLTLVTRRVRQGLSEVEALREWTTLAQVDALERLVGVLALNEQAQDLGRLISEEARSVRRQVHREALEAIERRDQQVWIPVTVAALVPGVIFVAIPFAEAIRFFTG